MKKNIETNIQPEVNTHWVAKIKMRTSHFESMYTVTECANCSHEVRMGNDYTHCPYCGIETVEIKNSGPFKNVIADDLLNK